MSQRHGSVAHGLFVGLLFAVAAFFCFAVARRIKSSEQNKSEESQGN